MILKRGGSHGVGVDTGKAPAITYDGKWSGWHIETYGGIPYWEAVFYTSGVLTVEGEYNADLWGIGGGGYSNGKDRIAGRGSTSILEMILTGTHAITIGAGGTDTVTGAGGGTMIDSKPVGAGGVLGAAGGGFPYRFGDPDKAGEEGESGEKYAQNEYFTYGWGEGGWLHWGYNISSYDHSGRGYGAGGARRYSDGVGDWGHDGALVIRIEIK